MDEILELEIVQALSAAGYEKFNKRALSFFGKVVKNHLNTQLVYLSSIASHSQKSKVTMLDLIKLINLSKSSISSKDFHNYQSFEFTEEFKECERGFENPIASAIEKYIHIYEFMPDFPPTHTFKKTFLKEDKKENKASKLKKQIEQSTMAERNLIKMLKATGKFPRNVNFMRGQENNVSNT